MANTETRFITMTCDGPNCDKTVTFDAQLGKETAAENPWMQNMRLVQTPDGRVLAYCGDTCEVDNIATGAHNRPEEKKVINISNPQAVALAAKAAEKAKEATAAIKAGRPAQVTLER